MVGIDHRYEYVADHATHEDITDIGVHCREIRFAADKWLTITAPEDNVRRKQGSGLLELLQSSSTSRSCGHWQEVSLGASPPPHLMISDSFLYCSGLSSDLMGCWSDLAGGPSEGTEPPSVSISCTQSAQEHK